MVISVLRVLFGHKFIFNNLFIIKNNSKNESNKYLKCNMELNKKTKVFSTFFLIKDLNPFFYELVIDSIDSRKISKRNFFLLVKTKKLLNLRISNKTLALFLVYLNIFSAKTINLQKTIKEEVNIQSIRNDLLYSNSITKNKLMRENELPFNKLNPRFQKSLFFNIYLSRFNKYSALNTRKSMQIIKNLNNI